MSKRQEDALRRALDDMERLAALGGGDKEANGSEADRILGTYLRDSGAKALADAYQDVECWRA